MIVQVPGRSHETYTDASVLETLPKLQGVHNKNSKEEFQLHGRQGGTDQDIRPRGDCRDPSHSETEKSRDAGGSSTGMRGGSSEWFCHLHCNKNPTETSLNSSQSTMSLEQQTEHPLGVCWFVVLFFFFLYVQTQLTCGIHQHTAN